jgi:hypothetical protein
MPWIIYDIYIYMINGISDFTSSTPSSSWCPAFFLQTGWTRLVMVGAFAVAQRHSLQMGIEEAKVI